MYRQLDLFGELPEEKPVAAAPGVSAKVESLPAGVVDEDGSVSEVKLHVSPPPSANSVSLLPTAVTTAQTSKYLAAEPVENYPEESARAIRPAATVTFVDKDQEPGSSAPAYKEAATALPVSNAVAKKGKRGRKSQKEMEAEAAAIDIPEDAILFKKQYYSIGEVSRMFKLNSSLLRYWESEFDIIKPRKNRKGDRHFRPEDIKNLYLIHHLLRARKYTIEGAKAYLKKNKNKASENFEIIQKLEKFKQFLLELKAGL